MPDLSSFKKILVANRGEIALRIIRSARRMGISTVAVYSRADQHAAHVHAADEAVFIGESAPGESYLNASAIVQAAQLCNADAIHPGYGFLAENAAFANACAVAGIVFIGPSPQAIRDMGDKANAKQLMRAADVPCVPGYDDEDQTVERLRAEADRIGYPVMIKATAGGGGRGMRIVFERDAFVEALHSAKSEAQSAFGNDFVILERAVQSPRHIEIQVVADHFGNVVHLGERDCSVQRRHQKIIEEAPGPGISDTTRDAMGRAAVTAAKAIGYEGVGTLEFLLDADGAFYFMEMNTRLQVEHPVTEAITGLDLVEMQINIAMGYPLAISQADVTLTGHAIEVRLCAEDSDQHFMPQSGRIALWQPPENVRVESGIRSGDTISPYYDSMFAKLIVHAPDRDTAIRQMHQALQRTVLLGVRTNISFLSRCLQQDAYVRGAVDTGFIAAHHAALTCVDEIRLQHDAALAAAVMSHHAADPIKPIRRIPTLLTLRTDDDTTVEMRVLANGDHIQVWQGDTQFDVTLVRHSDGTTRYLMDGAIGNMVYVRDRDTIYLHRRGMARIFHDASLVSQAQDDDHANGELRAATSSRVIEVRISEGDTVAQGDVLAITEAMKMQTQHIAPFDGVVRRVLVQAGDQADHRSLLVVLDPQQGA